MAEHVFGGLTLFFCAAGVLIGVPSLIVKYHYDERCGLTLINILLTLGVLLSRSAYAICVGARYIIVPDIICAVLFFIILGQYFRYRPSPMTLVEE